MTGPLRPRDDIDDLEGYHSPQVDVSVRLNTNESPYLPPPEFVDAWLDALRSVSLNRYPDRSALRLRRALGAFLDEPPERIFCANGSNEVIQTLLLTYGGPGRRAVVFEPTYALHSHITRITGTDLVEGERGADFTVDADAARELVREVEPAVTFLCSPNNPTGTVEPLETIEALLEATDGLVVLDEAYGEFAPERALSLGPSAERLVVVRTYSKVWSMAALRLGFCVAAPHAVADLEKVVLPYHLAAPTLLAGELALDHVNDMRDRVARLVVERERLVAALGELRALTVYPSGANFVLVRVGADAQQLWERLVARGVLVRDLSRRPRLEGCLRITVGMPDENEACLAAMREALEEMAA